MDEVFRAAGHGSSRPTVQQRLGRGVVKAQRYWRALIFIFNIWTILLAGFGCSIVYIFNLPSVQWKFRIEWQVLAVGTVFPAVFGIGQAFTRREKALSCMSGIKACCLGLYLCHRDWDVSDGMDNRRTLGVDYRPDAIAAKGLLYQLLVSVKLWLLAETAYESDSELRVVSKRRAMWRMCCVDTDLNESMAFSHRSKAKLEDLEGTAADKPMLEAVYEIISRLSVLNELLTIKAGYPKAGEGGMSRLAQYLRQIMEFVEALRFIKTYRTPIMLRHACVVMTIISIFLVAPNCAWYCNDWIEAGHSSGTCPAGYFTMLIYILVVTTLYHVWVDLEFPFDREGLDDCFFDTPQEFLSCVSRFGMSGTSNSPYLMGSAKAGHNDPALLVGQSTAPPLMAMGEIDLRTAFNRRSNPATTAAHYQYVQGGSSSAGATGNKGAAQQKQQQQQHQQDDERSRLKAQSSRGSNLGGPGGSSSDGTTCTSELPV